MSLWQLDIEYRRRVVVAVFLDPAAAKRAHEAVLAAMRRFLEAGKPEMVEVDVIDGQMTFLSSGLKHASLRMNDPELHARVHVRQQQLAQRAQDLANKTMGILK